MTNTFHDLGFQPDRTFPAHARPYLVLEIRCALLPPVSSVREESH
ncbi:UNVERIFIED_ORG: hypothetical protein ABIC54_006351 [Burkholderia sp. 1263]